jgi:parallel beta-helix repeat protein
MRPLVPILLLAGCATTIERPVPSETPFRISGSNRVFDFGGAEIVGKGSQPDEFEGTAIVVEGGRDITIRNVRIRGFKVAIHAIGVERLTIEDCDLSGNWRQRLNSTVDAEAPEDWLYGHRNDDNEWLRYGAGIYLDRCPNAVIRRNVGRNGQNGICIARSDGARIYDNDFSFNSGWGLAMYRSSLCIVSRNKFDWCIRGYSHEVYSRGQDSTGILVYEQCSHNVFAYNSATHGGDGFFLWAGHETLDKTGEGGSNFNLLYRNDFSHAAANGIEATFSVGNRFIENRLEECDHGIWAGYSSETEIRGNYIARNENGISIEHGQWNSVVENAFERNGTAVNLWWDRDEDLFKTAFGSKRNLKSENYLITDNTFRNDATALKVRESSWVIVAKNNFVKSSVMFDFDSAIDTFAVQDNNFGDFEKPPDLGLHFGANWWKRPPPGARLLDHPAESQSTAVEAPPIFGSLDAYLPAGALRGRKHIYVDEWGPRDPSDPRIAEERKKQAVNLAIGWKVAFHAWESAGAGRAPTDWDAVKASTPVELERADRLDYRWPGQPTKDVPADFFATIATTEVELEAGEYELRTISDDGIRVTVDEKVVIEDWSWHPPKTHTTKLTLSKGKHAIRVEHFEIDGYAQLSVRLRPSR